MTRRIVLFVEGHSERQSLGKFLKRWLDPQLPSGRGVGLQTVGFKGIDNYFDEVGSKVKHYLESSMANFALGVVDLYGMSSRVAERYPVGAATSQKVSIARSALENQVPQSVRDKFRQHFAVHEFEAWLLAYPNVWPQDVIKAINGRSPEKINFSEPPSRLLRTALRGNYKKTTSARNVLLKVDPAVATRACPHLKLLADDLLRVARSLV